jgi:hypothetical protein
VLGELPHQQRFKLRLASLNPASFDGLKLFGSPIVTFSCVNTVQSVRSDVSGLSQDMCLGCAPVVAVMETADLRDSHDAPLFRWLHSA